jgi:hypothetical protein
MEQSRTLRAYSTWSTLRRKTWPRRHQHSQWGWPWPRQASPATSNTSPSYSYLQARVSCFPHRGVHIAALLGKTARRPRTWSRELWAHITSQQHHHHRQMSATASAERQYARHDSKTRRRNAFCISSTMSMHRRTPVPCQLLTFPMQSRKVVYFPTLHQPHPLAARHSSPSANRHRDVARSDQIRSRVMIQPPTHLTIGEAQAGYQLQPEQPGSTC